MSARPPLSLRSLAIAVAAVAMCLIPIHAGEPAPEPPLLLTQFDVIQMSQQGMPADAIISKLRQAGAKFTLTPADRANLRLAGVSPVVLAAMIDCPPEPAPFPRGMASPAAGMTMPLRPMMARPVGRWLREVGPLAMKLHITEDRLVAELTQTEGEESFTVSLDADYSVNPEGLVYGVITGIDCNHPEMGPELQLVAGHTFSLRCRVDGDAMSVREVKFAGSGLLNDANEVGQVALMAAGRYRKDDGRAMRPVARKPAAPPIVPVVNREIVPGSDLRPVERFGIDFNPPPVPPGEFGRGGLGPLGVGRTSMPSMPAPVAGILPGLIPPMAPPSSDLIPPTAYPSVPVGAATGLPVGNAGPVAMCSFSREVDGARILLKLGDHRLRAEVAMAIADGDRVRRFNATLCADCTVSLDGRHFGTITSAELTAADDAPPDRAGETAAVRMMMSRFVGEVVSFRVRTEEGEMTLRDLKVSCPEGVGEREAMTEVKAMMSGRYKPALAGPQPAVKPGMPVPSLRERLWPIHQSPERIHGGIIE